MPDGADESANVELRRWGEPRAFDFAPREHDELGAALGMDFERAAKLSGARFVVLFGPLARLERALAAFMLDLQTREHGYTEVAVPYLVRDDVLFGTGQLPKFADDQFRTTDRPLADPDRRGAADQPGRRARSSTPSALPLRYTAYTPCFRSEAGAAGKDTRGMIRQHQFTKVELVSITPPEQSEAEHERMTGLRRGRAAAPRAALPRRRAVQRRHRLPGAQDLRRRGLAAGAGRYREISSCSNCGDFQARRMRARYRAEGRAADRARAHAQRLRARGRPHADRGARELPAGRRQRARARRRCGPIMDGLERLSPDG